LRDEACAQRERRNLVFLQNPHLLNGLQSLIFLSKDHNGSLVFLQLQQHGLWESPLRLEGPTVRSQRLRSSNPFVKQRRRRAFFGISKRGDHIRDLCRAEPCIYSVWMRMLQKTSSFMEQIFLPSGRGRTVDTDATVYTDTTILHLGQHPRPSSSPSVHA